MGQLRLEQENMIFKAIQECSVSVDKDELLKALKYDRDQYRKGYRDGCHNDYKAYGEIFLWTSVDEALPEEDEVVLVTVDGKPRENINLIGAYFLAEHSKEDGWILEGHEEWEKGFKVTYWCALPAPPDCYKAS